MAKLLEGKEPSAKILVFGNIYAEIENLPDNIYFMGLYKREELPRVLKENSISVVFFSSIVPETFSYVVQEMMLLEVPIVCFNIGAPPERIRALNYKPSCIIPTINTEEVLACIKKLLD